MSSWLVRNADDAFLVLAAAGIAALIGPDLFGAGEGARRAAPPFGFGLLTSGLLVITARIYASGQARVGRNRRLERRFYREHEPIRFHLAALAHVCLVLLTSFLAVSTAIAPLPAF